MARPKRFKGPRTPLTRSKYGQTVRDAKDQRLNALRAQEQGDKLPTSLNTPFVEVVKSAKKKGK